MKCLFTLTLCCGREFHIRIIIIMCVWGGGRRRNINGNFIWSKECVRLSNVVSHS